MKSPDFAGDTYLIRDVNFNESYAAVNHVKFLKYSLQGRFIDHNYRRAPWTFLLKNPHIDDDNEVEGSWSARRNLGEGGFGTVALWEKTTNAGEVADEMAVKEVHRAEWGIEGRPGLAREASINRDINTQDLNGTTNFLRAFKHNPPTSYSRYYMIFSPHGTLDDLKDRYQCWDTHLNELFILHVLIQLCKALLVLEQEPPASTLGPLPDIHQRQGYFALHRDIKPENIFLDYAKAPDLDIDLPTFPELRLADFGLTVYKDGTEPANHDDDAGTPYHMPPEQTEHGRDKWRILPHALPYQKPHNVWAVGKTLFDIMCHFDSSWLERLWMDKISGTSIINRGIIDPDDEHFMDQDFSEMLKHPEIAWVDAAEDMPYTEELMKIVFDCLKPMPEQRPSTADLLERAIEVRAEWLEGQQMGKKARVFTVRDSAKVFFEENEINNMPRGAANYGNDESFARLYRRQQQRGDPDWPRLQGPLEKWGHLNVKRTSDAETLREPKVPKIPAMLVADDDLNEIKPQMVFMGRTLTDARKALKQAKKAHLARQADLKASETSAGAIGVSKTGRSTRSGTTTTASGKRKNLESQKDSSSEADEPIRKRKQPARATKAPAKPKKPVKKSTRRPPANSKRKGKAPPRKVQRSSSEEGEEDQPAPCSSVDKEEEEAPAAVPLKDPTETSRRPLRPRKRDAR